jgi:hypothetical protein
MEDSGDRQVEIPVVAVEPREAAAPDADAVIAAAPRDDLLLGVTPERVVVRARARSSAPPARSLADGS